MLDYERISRGPEGLPDPIAMAERLLAHVQPTSDGARHTQLACYDDVAPGLSTTYYLCDQVVEGVRQYTFGTDLQEFGFTTLHWSERNPSLTFAGFVDGVEFTCDPLIEVADREMARLATAIPFDPETQVLVEGRLGWNDRVMNKGICARLFKIINL